MNKSYKFTAFFTVVLSTTAIFSANVNAQNWTYQENFNGTNGQFLGSPNKSIHENWEVMLENRDHDKWAPTHNENIESSFGTNCEEPGTHNNPMMINDHMDNLYICNGRLISNSSGPGYAANYMRPNQFIDLTSATPTKIEFETSFNRTSYRDWFDIFLMPAEDDIMFSLEPWIADGQGQPRNALHFRLDFGLGSNSEFNMNLTRWENYQERDIGGGSFGISQNTNDKFKWEITLSENDIQLCITKVGTNNKDCFIQTDSDGSLAGYENTVFALGHHSYNPRKTSAPNDSLTNPQPTTWAIDNLKMTNSVPFSIIKPYDSNGKYKQYVKSSDSNKTIRFETPAPEGSVLRFLGRGKISASFDGGNFTTLDYKPGSNEIIGSHSDGSHSSYSVSIPEGTQEVTFNFADDGWWSINTWGGIVQDFHIWSTELIDLPDGGGDTGGGNTGGGDTGGDDTGGTTGGGDTSGGDTCNNPFPDISCDNIFMDNIQNMKDIGIAGGYSDGLFRGGNIVTRGQTATFFVRAFDLKNTCQSVISPFTDSIEGPHKGDILTASCLGIVNGYSDGRYGQDDPVTREQLTKILYNIMGTTGKPIADCSYISYPDIDNTNKFIEYICPVTNSGIMNGYSNGKFGVGDGLERQQLMKVLDISLNSNN